MSVEWWKIVSVVAVASYAATILWDAFMFKDNIYKNAEQPLVITSLMQIFPMFLLPFIDIDLDLSKASLFAFTSGVLNMVGYGLYFKSLNHDQDAVVTAIMWNLLIAFIPIIAFFMIGERLELVQYVGITVVLVGALVASYRRARVSPKAVAYMFFAVLLLSVSWVGMEYSYVLFAEQGNESIFLSGLLLRSLGCVAIGLILLLRVYSANTERRDLNRLVAKYWKVFVMIELLQVAGDTFSSLAITEGDISVVTAIEGLMSGFTLFFSFVLIYIFRYIYIRPKLMERAVELYQEHLENFGLKVTGMVLIMTGAYLAT